MYKAANSTQLPKVPILRIFFLLAGLTAAALCKAVPAVALYYGDKISLKEFRVFDIVVVEPDHGHDPERYSRADSQLFAYVSVTEARASRQDFKSIPAAWRIARNHDWGADVIDQTPASWPDFFAEQVVGPLWAKGYRGFFLDALDSYRLAKSFDEAAQQAGLVRVIETLHRRFPGIQLILNRGFEIVPQVRDKIRMVAAESIFHGWNAATQRYEPVTPADREWLVGQLKTIRERDGLEILAIDYVASHDRKLTRETARKIQALGFIPWVTDAKLESIGIGTIESHPRRILLAYDSRESPSVNFSTGHRFLQMPLNHLGYVVDYLDVNERTWPSAPLADRYAGIVTWFSGGLADNVATGFGRWIGRQISEGMRVAVIGNFGYPFNREQARELGLERITLPLQKPARVGSAQTMIGFEAKPQATIDLVPLQLKSAQAQSLLEIVDAKGAKVAGGAIMPWGGFILDPFAVVDVPGTQYFRWVVDPFAFLQASLRLEPMPVPDVTTENGRRLLFSHIDGDGFPSLAELPGSPIAAEVLLKEVLERYRLPTTMSVIEAEVSGSGLYPKLSPQLENIARRMFRLPHVEIASHTFAHPFSWDRDVRHGVFKDAKVEYYHLDVPGYQFDLNREIVGSTNYIRDRLAPSDKPVRILLWSGDTAPSAEALKIAERAGLLNMNGGDTSISRQNPTLTEVGALGIEKEGFLQVYAPITNENNYTNLWRGPFYGYERVIETFELTESPRRLKPVDIYFHTYSASKRAGLTALHKVHSWAMSKPLHPVFASEYLLKVRDFHDIAIAREDDGWRVRGNGDLRTVRLAEGQPILRRSSGVAGFRDAREGRYIHLAGASASFATGNRADNDRPYLFDANARITDWRTNDKILNLTLKGHAPLEFGLADSRGCLLRANGRDIKPLHSERSGSTNVQHYRLKDAAAQIEVSCRGH